MVSVSVATFVLSLVALSCNPKENAVQSSSELRVKAEIQGNVMSWTSSSRIFGIDSEGGIHASGETVLTPPQYAEFKFKDWASGLQPQYFVYNHQSSTVIWGGVKMQGADILVKLPSSQTISEANSCASYAPVTVGKAENGEKPCRTTMHAVCGFVKVAFGSVTNVRKLAFSSVENVPICGEVLIPTSSVDSGEPSFTAGAQSGSSIDVWPASAAATSSCFKLGAESTYLLCVLPNTDFTPVLTFTDSNGGIAVKTLGKVTVSRGAVLDLGVIDDGLDFQEPGTMPSVLTFNFDAWPFAGGSTYTYRYSDQRMGYNGEFSFSLDTTPSGEDCIVLPAIGGRSLKNVSIGITEGESFAYSITDAVSGGNTLHSATISGYSTVAFNGVGAATTTEGKSYCIILPQGRRDRVSSISLTWTIPERGYAFDGELYHDIPVTAWEIACRDRADLLYNVAWTTLGKFSRQRKGLYFNAGEDWKGIPYSSIWSMGNGSGFVGNTVSFYTFLSAIHNPKGRIYQIDFHDVEPDGTAGCLYGSVCSTTAMYILGYPETFTTLQIFHTMPPFLDNLGKDYRENKDIRLYDCFCFNTSDNPDIDTDSGHALVIQDVARDESGAVKKLTVEEGWPPTTRRVEYTTEDFIARLDRDGKGEYRLFRVRQKDFTCKTLPFAEQKYDFSYTFPEDLCLDDGDKKTYAYTVSDSKYIAPEVIISILSDKYDRIELKRNGEDYLTRRLTEENRDTVRFCNLPDGLYEARLSDGVNSSAVPTKFQIVKDLSIKITLSGGRIYVTVPEGFVPATLGLTSSGNTHLVFTGRTSGGEYIFPIPEGLSYSRSAAISFAGEYSRFKYHSKIKF